MDTYIVRFNGSCSNDANLDAVCGKPKSTAGSSVRSATMVTKC